MQSQRIDFRLSRDFGEVINATFQFVQQNFRKLFSCILFIGGPFALPAGLSTGLFQLYMIELIELTGSILSYSRYFFSVQVFTLQIVLLVAMSTVYHYIYLYIAGTPFETADVWRLVRRDFWKVLFSGIGIVLLSGFGFMLCFLPGLYLEFLSGFGFMLCFLPGLYLFFALTPVFNIQTYERLGFFEAILRSFKLISGRWWRTFGIWFVMSLLQALISFIVVSPLYMALRAVALLTSGMGITLSTLLYTIAQSLNNILFLLYGSLVFVAMAFHYFSLVEEKEELGLIEKIQMMGSQPNDTPEEEKEQY